MSFSHKHKQRETRTGHFQAVVVVLFSFATAATSCCTEIPMWPRLGKAQLVSKQTQHGVGFQSLLLRRGNYWNIHSPRTPANYVDIRGWGVFLGSCRIIMNERWILMDCGWPNTRCGWLTGVLFCSFVNF